MNAREEARWEDVDLESVYAVDNGLAVFTRSGEKDRPWSADGETYTLDDWGGTPLWFRDGDGWHKVADR